MELVASVDLDCSDVLRNHISVHLEINKVYFNAIRTSDTLFGDFQLFTSIVSSGLPDISVNVAAVVDNVLEVSGCGVAGLRYKLLVADLTPIIVQVGINGLFDVNVDISSLQEGEISITLRERGSGRSCEASFIHEIVSLVSEIIESVLLCLTFMLEDFCENYTIYCCKYVNCK